jgi:hypothetical protein
VDVRVCVSVVGNVVVLVVVRVWFCVVVKLEVTFSVVVWTVVKVDVKFCVSV